MSIIPFDVSGAMTRFGVTDDGTPYAVAADFAKAVRLLDEDEKGTQIVSTPGGSQPMTVIFEDGLWELIFRSTLPGAKAVKAQVKAILRTIRETGRYEAAPRPEPTKLELARDLVAALEDAEAARARVAELEPDARSWRVLASGEGDYSVADAAKILSRDGGIRIGRTRLFAALAEQRWTYRQPADDKPRARQYAVERGWLSELPQSYEHPRTGELVLAAPQVRITAKGLAALHRRLGGAGVLVVSGGAR